MASIEKILAECEKAKINISYDDVLMKITEIKMQNDSEHKVLLRIDSKSWSILLEAKENINIVLPENIKPDCQIVDVDKDWGKSRILIIKNMGVTFGI